MLNGKYGVIDIGSNSVRLMMIENFLPIYKQVNITKLAKGFGDNFCLNKDSVERTAFAVSEFYKKAKEEGALNVFAFATQAVRKAKNKEEFLSRVKNLCGLDVDIVSGDSEALLGAKGALNNSDGSVIDIGGASTEIIVMENGNVKYSKSLDIGAVVLKDRFNDDKLLLESFLSQKVKEYNLVKGEKFYGIGGTITTVSAIMQELSPYDPTKTHGYVIKKDNIFSLKDRLYAMSVEDRKGLKGLQPERAEVIASGVSVLCELFNYLSLEEITVSESDNLEGYFYSKSEKL